MLLRVICAPKKEEVTASGENYIVRSFKICAMVGLGD
jgi:hypothetical protein